MSSLGQLVRRSFTRAASDRQVFEKIWIQDLRQYKGIYDPEVQVKMTGSRSKAFIRETRTKVRTLDARIMDLLFPANGDKNWVIKVTPIPSLPEFIEKQLIVRLQRALIEAGENRQPTQDEVAAARKAYAQQTCDAMSMEIDDQLSNIQYRSVIRNVMHSGHLYGTGWLKGPLVERSIEKRWELRQTGDGNFAWGPVEKVVQRPYAEFKPIWSVYPDMSVTELSQCRFVVERHLMQRHAMLKLAARRDFNSDIIKDYLEDNPYGNATYSTYESELYNMKDEGTTAPRTNDRGLYEVLEYSGYVSIGDVRALGISGMEALDSLPDDDYPANVWTLNDEVIKVSLDVVSGVPIPYYVYYFDKDETSIFGEGIAAIMRDPQRLLNASVRALIDNAAHCAGPQYEVNVDLLAEGEDPTDIGAFKVWLRTGKDADVAGREVVRVKTLASYTPEFMSMYSMFSKLGDETTIIPRYLQGDSRVSGAGRTASGLSMLMGQANVGLSDLVKFFDDGITKPFITAMYNWNMEFNEKAEIKGDMQIIAQGSTALMAKEVRAQQIQMFLQMTMNPVDLVWTKRGNLLRRWAESTDIGTDDAVLTEEEHRMAMEQQQGMQQQQQGAGYNQLESIIKQMEEGMQMMADKVGRMENFIIESLPAAINRRQALSMETGGPTV